jgi:hypothetical protein
MQKVIVALQQELTQIKSQVDEVKQNNNSIPFNFAEEPEPVKKDVELRTKEPTKKEVITKKKVGKSASSSKAKSKKDTSEKAKAKPEAEKEKEADKEPTKDKPLIEKHD